MGYTIGLRSDRFLAWCMMYLTYVGERDDPATADGGQSLREKDISIKIYYCSAVILSIKLLP